MLISYLGAYFSGKDKFAWFHVIKGNSLIGKLFERVHIENMSGCSIYIKGEHFNGRELKRVLPRAANSRTNSKGSPAFLFISERGKRNSIRRYSNFQRLLEMASSDKSMCELEIIKTGRSSGSLVTPVHVFV